MPTNMHKKPPRNNRRPAELRTVHTAGAEAARLLQRITRRAQVVLPGAQGDPAGAAAERSWLERLRAALPEELRPHLRSVLEKPDGLVLFAGSAVWAGRLKLALPELAGVAGGRDLRVRLDTGRGRGA